jgi:hypothetical protein
MQETDAHVGVVTNMIPMNNFPSAIHPQETKMAGNLQVITPCGATAMFSDYVPGSDYVSENELPTERVCQLEALESG